MSYEGPIAVLPKGETMSKNQKGSCLCGAVTYEVSGELRPVCACHCNQCRKTSGHYVAATQARSEDLTIHGDAIQWYQSSDKAERGFCGTCGSNLFWRRFAGKKTSIFAGTLDGETGLTMDTQIHSQSAGDYYSLPDVRIGEQSEVS